MADLNDRIVQFCELTGADPQLAQKYLRVSDGSLDAAVALYMDTGGADLPGDDEPRPVPTQTVPDEVDEDIPSDIEFGDDPPLPHTTPLRAGLLRDQFALDAPGPAAPRPPNPFWQQNSDPAAPAHPFSAAESKLASLFRPPSELMFKGSFDSAKERGKREKKWLLVDLQDPTEFPCQVLNRDVWKHSAVEAAVRAHYLFLQLYTQGDQDGATYKSFYPVSAFPHVAILDPRTGERVQVLQPKQLADPQTVATVLTEFAASASLTSTAPVPVNVPVERSSVPKKSVTEMTEDEQLQAALAASLQDSEAAGALTHTPSAPPPPQELDDVHWLAQLPEWTDEDLKRAGSAPDATRIQLRIPESRPVVLRIAKSAPVVDVFRFARQQLPPDHAPFELVYVRDNLTPLARQGATVEQAGLVNASVVVAFL